MQKKVSLWVTWFYKKSKKKELEDKRRKWESLIKINIIIQESAGRHRINRDIEEKGEKYN